MADNCQAHLESCADYQCLGPVFEARRLQSAHAVVLMVDFVLRRFVMEEGGWDERFCDAIALGISTFIPPKLARGSLMTNSQRHARRASGRKMTASMMSAEQLA